MKPDNRAGVLMVIGSFFPEITGGGLQALSLMAALKEDVRFYVITITKNMELPLEDALDGIKVFRVLACGRAFFWKIKAFVRSIIIFLRIQREIGVVHLHGFSQKSVMFILLAKIFGKKIIEKTSSLGIDDPVSIKSGRFGKFKFLFYSMCDAFISISPAISKRFESFDSGKDKMLFIPNGVDIERFKPMDSDEQKRRLKQDLGLNPDCKVILYVGFFSYDKSPDMLWRSYCSLSQDLLCGTQLVFVGSKDTGYFEISSELIEYIKEDILKKNMADKVLFVDKTLYPDRYYKACDIFVLTSKREGLPNALIEAMACGVPCVAARISGVTDYLINDKEDGLLFESGNEDDLRDKLSILLRDYSYSRILGGKAREKIKNTCDIRAISKRYLEVYRGL